MFEKVFAATPSSIFFFCSLAFIGGVLIASFLSVSWVIVFAVAAVVIVGGVLFPRVTLISVCGLFLCLGFAREQLARRAIETISRDLIGKTVEIQGHVTSDPTTSARAEFFTVSFHDSAINVITRPNTIVARGDLVNMQCRFQASEAGGVECPFPKQFQNNGPSSTPDAWLRIVRDAFVDKLNHVFASPMSGFLSGLLVTGSTNLTPEWRQVFRTTGTAHLVALSGYNVSIIATVILWLLARLAVPKKWRLFCIGLMLFVFVIMVGAGASIVRAAIMGMLAAYAAHIGRPSYTKNSIVAAAALMLVWDPTLLVQSLSFQLSFLATIAVVTIYPWLESVTALWPSLGGAKEAMLMTVAAEILVMPLLTYAFGQLSVISPFVNALVVPLVPLLMLFAFGGAVAGFVSISLGRVVGFPAWAGSVYVLKLIQWSATLSFAALQFSISIWIIVLYYSVIVLGIWYFRRKKSRV